MAGKFGLKSSHTPYTKKPFNYVWVLVKVRLKAGSQLLNHGRILFEVAGVSEEVAREALRLASHKLPVKTKFVKREELVVEKQMKAKEIRD